MSSEGYLLILFLATALQFCAFAISIYALRFVAFRAAWVAVGIVTLLMAVRRSIFLVGVWTGGEIKPVNVTAELIALLISILMVIGLSLGLSAVRRLNQRLEISEINRKTLQESELKFRALTESSAVGFVVLDAKGKVLECNEAYIELM